MTITLGKTQVSMMNPPNEGIVIDIHQEWKIGRNGSGLIVLRKDGRAHPDFYAGMDILGFCEWINGKRVES